MSTGTEQADEERMRRAVALHQNGQLALAGSLYEEILRSQPTHLKAAFLLGITYAQRNNFDMAAQCFGAAIKINPAFVDGYFNCGLALHSVGKFQEALEHYDHAIELKEDHAKALYNRGVLLRTLNRREEALRSFDQALNAKSDYLEAYSDRGVVLAELGRFNEALRSYDCAIALGPNISAIHLNRGVALSKLKQYEAAVGSYDLAIQLNPDSADAYLNRGFALNALQRFEEALANYDSAIRIMPDHAEAYSNRSIALGELKRLEDALRSSARAIEIKPELAEAHYNHAVVLGELKRFEEALLSYDQAIQLNPDHPDAHTNRGAVLGEFRRFEEALLNYDHAIRIKPDHANAHNNRGIALLGLGRLEEALAAFEYAIDLEPDNPDAHSNRGAALSEFKRFEEALLSSGRAIRIMPDHANAHNNRGIALLGLMRTEEALAAFEYAHDLKPDLDFLMGMILHMKMKMCDWTTYKDIAVSLCDQISKGERAAQPFQIMTISGSLETQRMASDIWVEAKAPARSCELPRYSSHEKIRVGYFSSTFRAHATATLIAELFERHDRSKFELIAFSFGEDTSDDIRARLKAAFDQFIDIKDMLDRDIVLLAATLEIDIAIDLNGFTDAARPNIFAMRAAPIQVNFLGYPGTMGADYIDYIIADTTLIPVSAQRHFAEKIAYLPNTYEPNDRKREISGRIFTRSELGLPENGFVFCCFNNNYKIVPEVFDSWMRILRRVEGSVLWLFEDNEFVPKNLRREASIRKIDPNRLVFAPRMALPDHLARHRAADLFLDTLPYNAHTTASDALWAGLPILTQLGDAFAGRVAASLLNAIGLPELITTTQVAYEALAIELATNPARLACIKQKLFDNRLTTPLFDCVLFTKHIEAAYTAMYEQYEAGLPPDHIHVPA